jgi:copper chaperone CopZ
MKQILLVITTILLLTLPVEAQKKSKTETTSFTVSIDCQHCIDTITKELAFVKGVRDLKFSLEETRVDVTYRPDKVSKETIAEKIRELGYEVKQRGEGLEGLEG